MFYWLPKIKPHWSRPDGFEVAARGPEVFDLSASKSTSRPARRIRYAITQTGRRANREGTYKDSLTLRDLDCPTPRQEKRWPTSLKRHT